MIKIYVSHSPADSYFAKLLIALLKFHHLETWYRLKKLPPDTTLSEEIENADYFVAIMSKNSLQSQEIQEELALRKKQQAEPAVIPILLDKIDFDHTIFELNKQKAIDFSECMLTGFQNLFTAFGAEFIPCIERRAEDKRRAGIDRRKESQILKRLRTDLWNGFHTATSMQEFDTFRFEADMLLDVRESIKKEVGKYAYQDSAGKPCEIDQVLDVSTGEVWKTLKHKKAVTALVVIAAISEKIHNTFKVKPIGRRTKSNRRLVYTV